MNKNKSPPKRAINKLDEISILYYTTKGAVKQWERKAYY